METSGKTGKYYLKKTLILSQLLMTQKLATFDMTDLLVLDFFSF